MLNKIITIEFLEDGNKVVISSRDIPKSQLSLMKIFSSILHLLAAVPPSEIEDDSVTYQLSSDNE